MKTLKFIGEFLEDHVFTIVMIMWISMFWPEPVFLFISLSLIAAIMILQKCSWDELIIFIYIGILGACIEMLPIAFGAWQYAIPQFAGIPWWLPIGWGIAGISGKRLYKQLKRNNLLEEDRKKKKK